MSAAADPVETFDVTGPLPAGLTLLEASAGTGKTFTIAALAARYVADGVPLERLLLVTFTRMATGELRERVRERLLGCERVLADVLAGRPAAAAADDVVSALLAEGTTDEVELRRARLARAVADFDAATIATTHGFCQEVLGGLGTTGDVERDVALVEDAADLEDEALADLYVRRYHARPRTLSWADARSVAAEALKNPATRLAHDERDPDDLVATRARLATAVREEVRRRKRQAGVMTYDDLLVELRDALAGEERLEAVRRLRSRFDAVLVDEFQDTDPVQWKILRRAFAPGRDERDAAPAPGRRRRALVLIGDPKQAIYAFRGADVHAYLDAAREADVRATLATNWRTDQGLLDALEALFGGARLGLEGIEFRTVAAVERHREGRLHDAPSPAPLRVRVVPRDDRVLPLTRTGLVQSAAARAHVDADLAADVAALLRSGATIEHEPGRRARVQPADVAVLVRTNRRAADVRRQLENVGVPAVINGAGSVFGEAGARQWLRLLEALERPSAAGRARAAALTPFLGWSAGEVAAADEDDWAAVHRRMHRWARLLRERGVAALQAAVERGEGLPGRVLAAGGGERALTDLRHVGQLLHAAATSERLGVTALAGWLRRRIADAERETDEERSRRLESDADAVQVLTVHRSKGLEFGIVYAPSLAEAGWIPDDEPVTFHDDDGVRTLDVAPGGRDFEDHHERHVAERRGEDLRLAYVALTRARHQAVVWWSSHWKAGDSPLGRLVYHRSPGGEVAPAGPTPIGDGAGGPLRELARRAGGTIAIERARIDAGGAWTPPAERPPELRAARFGRGLDDRWRRTSYSDLIAGRREEALGLVASEPESSGVDDEPDETTDDGPGSTPTTGGAADDVAADDDRRPSPMAELPAGPGFGTFVHRVLERVDFATADLDAALDATIGESLARAPQEVGDPTVLARALRTAIETPLGDAFGGVRLRDVGRADRLDELAFELPLAGGDARGGTVPGPGCGSDSGPGPGPAREVRLDRIAALLREHLDAEDPFAAYADRLAEPGLRARVRGYLTGSLDLVVRLPDGRFAVLDHKTNRLRPRGAPLLVGDHAPARLRLEMLRSHYVLQALLYLVALHRLLRWRIADYAPDRHLAGVGYLFLRGMAGPGDDGAAPHGVLCWSPPGALVTAISDALDGEAA